MDLKLPTIKWHPVTRQRWARFRGLRRGWWAFWILIGAYVLSLGSEWIANDRPLWIRFEGETYFPVMKFYPEDVFTGNGRMTRPDYKALAASETFAAGSGNRMVWPLIRCGPLESLKPADIVLPDTVTVVAVPEPRVASADVDLADVVRVAGDMEYFGLQVGRMGMIRWKLPPPIIDGLVLRLANRAAPAVDAKTKGPDGREAWISLSPYEPRGAAPARVRLTFRENLSPGAAKKAVVDEQNPVWPDGFPGPGTGGWTFTMQKEQVRFPFRPVKGHPLGIDSSGRDVAARMLYALADVAVLRDGAGAGDDGAGDGGGRVAGVSWR